MGPGPSPRFQLRASVGSFQLRVVAASSSWSLLWSGTPAIDGATSDPLKADAAPERSGRTASGPSNMWHACGIRPATGVVDDDSTTVAGIGVVVAATETRARLALTLTSHARAPKMPTSSETAPPGNLSATGRRMDDRSCPSQFAVPEVARRRMSPKRRPLVIPRRAWRRWPSGAVACLAQPRSCGS